MKNEQMTECKRSRRNNSIIRIEPDLYDELNSLSNMTRTSVKDVASKAIRFALQYAVMKPAE